MDVESIGVAIVGAGFVADLHTRVYRELAGYGVTVTGVSSRTVERAAALAQQYDIPYVARELDELLARDDVDIVDLCVPNQWHESLAVAAMQAGKHVICEKPLTGYFGEDAKCADNTPVGSVARQQMLAGALQSADRMLAAAQDAGVKLLYAENWLYSPVIRKAKRLIKASGGVIFDLRGEESHHGSHSSASKAWRSSGGGALIRLGSHPIGAILHLKQCEGIWRDGRPIEPVSVLADVANLADMAAHQRQATKWVVDDWADVENWAQVIITFADGSKATVTASDVCVGGLKATVDLYLSNARIHCDFARNNTLQSYAPEPDVYGDEYLVEKLETKAGWNFPSVDEDWFLGYHAELLDFVQAVREDRAPLSDAQLGRRVVEVIYQAYLSAEQGRAVRLDPTVAG